jgi:hypothetical protein
MYNRPFISKEQLAREKALHIYFSAFERGDFEKMASVLQDAEHDPILERLIVEVHEYYQAEEHAVLQAVDGEKVRQLVLQHLPSGIWDEMDELAIPPLTVGDVITRLQQDETLREPIRHEVETVHQHLQQTDQPLPMNLNLKSVYHLFEQLGLSVSAKLQKIFREKAIFLSMAREQGIAQIAATRHQQHQEQQRGQNQQEKSQP